MWSEWNAHAVVSNLRSREAVPRVAPFERCPSGSMALPRGPNNSSSSRGLGFTASCIPLQQSAGRELCNRCVCWDLEPWPAATEPAGRLCLRFGFCDTPGIRALCPVSSSGLVDASNGRGLLRVVPKEPACAGFSATVYTKRIVAYYLSLLIPLPHDELCSDTAKAIQIHCGLSLPLCFALSPPSPLSLSQSGTV